MLLRQHIAHGILHLFGWKAEDRLSDTRQCVLAIAPHTSNWDFVVAKLFGIATQRNGKFLIKKDWFFFPLNLFFNAIGGIPVDRSRRDGGLTGQLAEQLKQMDACIAITPEGTRKPVRRWKTGFYKIAVQTGVPILLLKLY